MKITYWSDYACPYCYIGEARMKKALEENDWVITKRMMKAVHDITVTAKLKDETKRYCQQLRISTREGQEPTNWYLLEERGLYSQELGFVQAQDTGTAFFVD